MELFRRAWIEVQPNVVGWAVYFVVLTTVMMATCGLGIVLMPNVYRELRDTRAEQRGPDLGRLFNFDRFSEDAFHAAIVYGATSLGSAAAGVGALVASVLLGFVFPMAADGRYEPMVHARLSMEHVLAHLETHLILLLGSCVMLFVLTPMTCGLFFFVGSPILLMAVQLHYEDSRPEIDAIAERLGLLTDGG